MYNIDPCPFTLEDSFSHLGYSSAEDEGFIVGESPNDGRLVVIVQEGGRARGAAVVGGSKLLQIITPSNSRRVPVPLARDKSSYSAPA